jgi:hypothetical protein
MFFPPKVSFLFSTLNRKMKKKESYLSLEKWMLSLMRIFYFNLGLEETTRDNNPSDWALKLDKMEP